MGVGVKGGGCANEQEGSFCLSIMGNIVGGVKDRSKDGMRHSQQSCNTADRGGNTKAPICPSSLLWNRMVLQPTNFTVTKEW